MLNFWYCERCNRYNDILTEVCWNCLGNPPKHIDGLYRGLVEIKRGIFLGYGILKGGDILMSDDEETVDTSFNAEKIIGNIKPREVQTRDDLFRELFLAARDRALDVNLMTIQQIEVWESELSDIAFRAKATLQGASEGKKTRVAKLSKEERDKLITNPDLLVSDAISTVTKRKDRMSKIDKLIISMKAMNMSDEDIKAAISNVKVDEGKQSLENELREKEIAKKKATEELVKKMADMIVAGNISDVEVAEKLASPVKVEVKNETDFNPFK